MIIYFNANKTHFRKKGCALGLIFSCSVFVLLLFFFELGTEVAYLDITDF